MRILYLTDSYRPARSACANRTAVLVDELRCAGHDVRVLASSGSLIGAPSSYRAPDFVSFFETHELSGGKTLVDRLRNNFGGCSASVRVARRLGEFDAVVCTTPPLLLISAAIKIAKMKGARLIWDVRDVWPDVAYEMGAFAPGSLYGRFFTHLARKGYRAADLIVSVSPGKVEKLRRRVSNRGECEVALIPNGIDESFVSIGGDFTLPSSFGMDNGGTTCVYVGNIGLAQGLGTLLDIAAARPAVRFLFFGDGADKGCLQERAAREDLANVEFHEPIDALGVRAVLSRADMSYIPLVSSRLRDSIPTKMYEALACGCPVLLAAEGDAAVLLDEAGIGLHASPEDGAALLAAFDALVDQPYSPAARRHAAAWTLENHSRQMFGRDFVRAIETLESGRHAR